MRARAGCALALAVPLLLAPAAPVPAGADAGLIALDLTLDQEGPLAQGEPRGFEVRLENRTPVTFAGSLLVTLRPAHGGTPVAVDRWSGFLIGLSEIERSGRFVTSQWFVEAGAFELTASGEFRPSTTVNLPTLATPSRTLTLDVTAPVPVRPLFEDAAADAGLDVADQHVACANYSSGAAWADVEGDGDLDLYVPQNEGGARLWLSQGGAFTDGAAAAGVLNEDRVGTAAVFGDYDNDGDPDLYAVNNGPNRLYRNDGDGTFTDVTAAAGIDVDGPGTSASWGDYDADGFLDLYVTNHGVPSTCANIDFQPYPDALYHNEGDGTFADVTELLPMGGGPGLGFQGTWFDYDDDGDVDLSLANDKIHDYDRPDFLWRNDGPAPDGSWTFTDVSEPSGAGISINAMGAAVGDYDRDGWPDLALSNIRHTKLLRNDGAGTFTERGEPALVARPYQRAWVPSVTWGIAFADLNLDGWEDLYVVAGDLEPLDTYADTQPNGLFVNAGDGRLLDLSAPSGTDDPGAGRGLALADYDRDGDMDMFVVNQAGAPRLYRNITPATGHWLEVDTVGTTSNRDGCGATVSAHLEGGVVLKRTVFCGSVGLGSGSDPTVHFGLGDPSTIEELTIRWPSGVVQTLTGVPADQRIEVSEP